MEIFQVIIRINPELVKKNRFFFYLHEISNLKKTLFLLYYLGLPNIMLIFIAGEKK